MRVREEQNAKRRSVKEEQDGKMQAKIYSALLS
jgi:hypothetical protein